MSTSSRWQKGLVAWEQDDALCISIPFTWLLPVARALALSNPWRRVVVGGPAVRLMPQYIDGWAEVETLAPDRNVLKLHNPDATRTSIGCRNACDFCSVRTITPGFREFEEWEPGTVICDDNLLACSWGHIAAILTPDNAGLDLQGIDPALVSEASASLIADARPRCVRMGLDTEAERPTFWRAVEALRDAGLPKRAIQAYCLVNFLEDPEEAMDRLQSLKSAGIVGFAMRYQPPDTLKKNSYLAPQWEGRDLPIFCRYWNRQSQLRSVKFEDYRRYAEPQKERLPL